MSGRVLEIATTLFYGLLLGMYLLSELARVGHHRKGRQAHACIGFLTAKEIAN